MKRLLLALSLLVVPVAHAETGDVEFSAVAQDVHVKDSVSMNFSVRNESDSPIENVQITARRGDPVTDAAGLEEYLVSGAFPYYGKQEFLDPLQPGESREVSVEVPMEVAPGSLAIDEPGTYPLLFTLTGTRMGEPVKLAQETQVISVGRDKKQKKNDLTVLFPISEKVNITPGETGADDLQLMDESLAKSLSDGGRVDEMLDSYLAHDLRGAGCVAIDPALLDAAERMTKGYVVGEERPEIVDKPKRLRDSWFEKKDDVELKEGTGSDSAKAFLDKLGAVDCIFSTPWANVDPARVEAVGNKWLTHEAVGRGTDTISRVLGKTAATSQVLSPRESALTRVLRSHPAALNMAVNANDVTAVVSTPEALDAAEQALEFHNPRSVSKVSLPSYEAETFPGIEDVRKRIDSIDELTGIMDNDPNITMTRYGYTMPMRREVLSAMSEPTVDVGSGKRIEDLRRSVALIPPGNVFTRVSESSPLVVVAENGLPLPVNAHIGYTAPEGTKLSSPDMLRIPARGSITAELTTKMPKDHDRVELEMWLASPDGSAISQPVSIAVQTRAGIVGISTFIALSALAAVIALIVRRKRSNS